MRHCYSLVAILSVTACSSPLVKNLETPSPQAQALDEMNRPFSNPIFQSVVCNGKVVVALDKQDQGPNVLFLDASGHWISFNKKDCK